jgi:cytochrome c oxidase subunit 1
MHFLGLIGMPRRTHTYLSGFGWDGYNMVCSIGAFILGFAVLLFVVDIVLLMTKGKPAGNDPWNARTLEWATTSPPRSYNFARIPIIPARDALWEHKHGAENRKITYVEEGSQGIHMPSQSWMPLVTCFGFVPLGLGVCLMQAGVAYMGYVAIGGLVIIALGATLWAIEGPGGYHIHPQEDEI